MPLALKAAVPAGYMVERGARTFTVQICHDASGNTGPRQIVVPRSAGHEDAAGKIAKETCPYAGLAMSGLGGADPVLLGLALAFIWALALHPFISRPLRRRHPSAPAAARPSGTGLIHRP